MKLKTLHRRAEAKSSVIVSIALISGDKKIGKIIQYLHNLPILENFYIQMNISLARLQLHA